MKMDFTLKIILLLIFLALAMNVLLSLSGSRQSYATEYFPPPPQIALSAGEKGVVYFYDGINLWFSRNYGGEWTKVK